MTQAWAQAPALGVTQALKDVKLSMTVAGRVDGVLVKEGQRVRKGQVLLYLDRTTEELEVRRRRLLLEDSSRLHELRAKEKTLNEQVAALKPLLASGGVSRKQLEDEELVLGAVIAERKMIESGKQREQVELELATESYERRHLRSPIQGVVSKVMPRIGESIAPHDPVVQVVDISRVRFVGNIPAKLGAGLQAGSKVRIRLGAEDNGLMREARVVFVSPVTDPASGLVEVIAEFDNADGSVRPGITGRLLF
jgi:RND family efflux transporter MFP subunit